MSKHPYQSYIPQSIVQHLSDTAPESFIDVEGAPGLTSYGPLPPGESSQALAFVSRLYVKVRDDLHRVLHQRRLDREFIDRRMSVCSAYNRERGIGFSSPDYITPLGLQDGQGRVVFGPLDDHFAEPKDSPVAPYPEALSGPQITLFGPPDSPQMAINAMNCLHRRLDGEPEIVGTLLAMRNYRPRWGADVEDSKTPIRADLAEAAQNLSACLRGTLEYDDPKRGKHYRINADSSALAIKRFPGLALPCGFLYQDGEHLPLHLYDFGLHMFHNWDREDGLVFYVPKLENEEEAAYINTLVAAAEQLIAELHPQYKIGSVKLMIVLENPRAILRTNEIIDALQPYFLGASLGWHDYLASTARLFKNDPNYRIPVKADPNIVIKHIKASHDLVARVVGGRGGLALGGMYGVLPLDSRLGSSSFTVTLAGFFKDVITQLKRGLSGFWVAHPDFVRIGVALVIAWELRQEGDPSAFHRLALSLLGDDTGAQIIAFADGDDIAGIDPGDPMYIRDLIVARLEQSDFIANNHPDEIRYNVFQTLQYLADWLSGNGCVALPASLPGADGQEQVRIMDDLATTERSRWELWHEIAHGRFSLEDFLAIALDELDFIRKDKSGNDKVVRIKWDARTAQWYPVAFHLMLQLVCDPKPVEFATELLLPFTLDHFRLGQASLDELKRMCPDKYALPPRVRRYLQYYDICGSSDFAAAFSRLPLFDPEAVQEAIGRFSLEAVLAAAAQHGDIGASRSAMDALAAAEQAGLANEERAKLEALSAMADEYRSKFGFKFLVSAAGKNAAQLQEILIQRMQNDRDAELDNARSALGEIAVKRGKNFFDALIDTMGDWAQAAGVQALSLALCDSSGASGLAPVQTVALGTCTQTLFDIASLSKTVGTAFAMEQLTRRGYGPDSLVGDVLGDLGSTLTIGVAAGGDPSWLGELRLRHLMSHCAMNMHYVPGVAHKERPESIAQLLANPGAFGYEYPLIAHEPGSKFSYSGAGFLLLEYICELMLGDDLVSALEDFVRGFLSSHEPGAENEPEASFSFSREVEEHRILGRRDSGDIVSEHPLWFPSFAAGCLANPAGMLAFLRCLSLAFARKEGCGPISHDTAVLMLASFDKQRSAESRQFMGLDMGLGVFTSPMGPNRIAVHQGANDGYRSIYLFVYDGPDAGKGFALFCNGDNAAVPLVARISRELIGALGIHGYDARSAGDHFSATGIAQEQIVNMGYKELLFSGIRPLLPDEHPPGPTSELLSASLIADQPCLACSDQRFARADSLTRLSVPVLDPLLYCSQGKVMDSWETSRHNSAEYDWAVFALHRPSRISYLYASTAYHNGNHAPAFALFALPYGDSDSSGPGSSADTVPDPHDPAWVELIPQSPCDGHSELFLELEQKDERVFSHVMLRIYPDGGFSRLALYAEAPKQATGAFSPAFNWRTVEQAIPQPAKSPVFPLHRLVSGTSALPVGAMSVDGKDLIDLASRLNGGSIEQVSNQHYGPAEALLSPMEPIHMFDGLESARSRTPGHREEAVIAFGCPGVIHRVEMDFRYFVNNNPVAIDVWALPRGTEDWVALAEGVHTKAFAGNIRIIDIRDQRVYEKIKLIIHPDGGMNRLRVWGSAQ